MFLLLVGDAFLRRRHHRVKGVIEINSKHEEKVIFVAVLPCRSSAATSDSVSEETGRTTEYPVPKRPSAAPQQQQPARELCYASYTSEKNVSHSTVSTSTLPSAAFRVSAVWWLRDVMYPLPLLAVGPTQTFAECFGDRSAAR